MALRMMRPDGIERAERARRLRRSVPAELRSWPQFVDWRYEPKPTKVDPNHQTKVPHIAEAGGQLRRAKSTCGNEAHRRQGGCDCAQRTWRSFDQAVATYVARTDVNGIGFVLSVGDPFGGIDLDDCIDPDTGQIAEWARTIVDSFASYAEISPSGTGIRILLEARMPDRQEARDKVMPQAGRKCGPIEAYSHARFLTLTGDHLEGTPATIERRQEELDDFLERYLPSPQKRPAVRPQVADGTFAPPAFTLNDEALLAKIRASDQATKFDALYHGDLDGKPSESEARMALLSILAWWTKDSDQVDRLFSASGRDQSKWGRLRDFEIAKALAFVGPDGYNPNGRAGSNDRANSSAEGDRLDNRAAETPTRPEVIISGRHLRELTADTVNVLAEANTPPVILQRSGQLVRMRVHEDGRPVLEAHTEHTLRERAAKIADWLKLIKEASKGEDEPTFRRVPSGPPLEVIRNLMAAPEWLFPAVTSITQAPALRPDGSILSQPGYDAATRLIYAPAEGLRVPRIPDHPTAEDRAAALATLDDVLVDFPFDGDEGKSASKAHTLALLLTAIARPAIAGHVPMAIITAPESGTGKGLLANLVAIIATGNEQQAISAPDKESEWRDSIFSALREGPAFVMLDNLRGALSAPALEMALTATTYKQRVKGFSYDEAVPQRAVWVATGNNLQLAGDMPRRCYRIWLDAKQPRPERRNGFKHPHLLQYARARRGQLLAALLTLARAWWADGCPEYCIPAMGSFEDWARIVGSILAHAGVKGFLSNVEDMYAEADPKRSQWAAFFAAWYETYRDERKTTAAIAADIVGAEDVASKYHALREVVPETLAGELASTGKFTRRLGYELRSQAERRYETEDGGEVWLTHGGQDTRLRAICWRVFRKSGPTPQPDPERDETQAQNHHSQTSDLNSSGSMQTLRVMTSDGWGDSGEVQSAMVALRDARNDRDTYSDHSSSLAPVVVEQTASMLSPASDGQRRHAQDARDQEVREKILALAQEMRWPSVPLKPPASVAAGESAWRRFVAAAGPDQLAQARDELERLSAQADQANVVSQAAIGLTGLHPKKGASDAAPGGQLGQQSDNPTTKNDAPAAAPPAPAAAERRPTLLQVARVSPWEAHQ